MRWSKSCCKSCFKVPLYFRITSSRRLGNRPKKLTSMIVAVSIEKISSGMLWMRPARCASGVASYSSSLSAGSFLSMQVLFAAPLVPYFLAALFVE